jgi:glycosyltransferase involved in cell wall biosynthesis
VRKGQNPAKDKLPAYRPPRLGVALLAYIPSLAGYYEHALEILRYQIASLHATTGEGFDLLVFDNGSCAEAQAELGRLHTAGRVDFLVVSRHNLGKIGALNWILGAMPNELICYADSDVLFRPGWLEASLEILEAFPKPGMVSAQPCLDDVLRGAGTALHILENDPRFEVESRPLDPQVVAEYALGVGLSPERAEKLKATLARVVTARQAGVRAVLGATHMQFIIPRVVAREIVPLPVTYGLGRQEDHNFDLQVDRAGALHLSTLEAYVWHMGNLPDEKTLAEVRSLGLPELLDLPVRRQAPVHRNPLMRLLRRLARLPLLRGAVYRLYNLLFELYAQ